MRPEEGRNNRIDTYSFGAAPSAGEGGDGMVAKGKWCQDCCSRERAQGAGRDEMLAELFASYGRFGAKQQSESFGMLHGVPLICSLTGSENQELTPQMVNLAAATLLASQAERKTNT